MKNKGVMISLAVLVLIGMMITAGIHNFIEKNSTGSMDLTTQVTAAAMDRAAEPEAAKAAPEEEMIMAADMGAGVGPVPMEAAGELQEDGQPQGMAGGLEAYALEPLQEMESDAPGEEAAPTFSKSKSAAAASPAKTKDVPEAMLEEWEEAGAADTISGESRSYYVKRLQDLDSQIQKNKESQTGANVNSSVKSAASSELKLWDSELNDIYNAILNRLDQQESEELVKEERAWLKERDSLAMEAAKNSAGGSSESIEYTISLMESTRLRAYELAQRYAHVLEE